MLTLAHSPRNMTLFTLASLGSGYFVIKSKTLADRQRAHGERDYTVTVDRSGTNCLPDVMDSLAPKHLAGRRYIALTIRTTGGGI
jgi:hypothetical protein